MIDLDKVLNEAIKEKERILTETAPLKAEKAKLMEEFAPIDKKLRAVQEKIADIEKKGNLADLSRTIIRLGKPTGRTITMKAETGHFEKK